MGDRGNIKPVDVLRGLPTEQNATAPPVVAAPRLPAMEKAGEVKTVLRNTLLPLMGAGTPQHTGGVGQMDPVPTQIPPSTVLSAKPQEPKAGPPPSSAADGYVRMEVHVDNGKLSVVGVKHVPGPLALPSALIRGYAYEVLLDDQQVGLGSLPDVGVQRAFANRDVEGPQGKHHFGKLPTFDFSVRIPAAYVVTANLPKLNVVLHNVEDAPDRLTSLAPLGRQPGVKTTEVGRLPGIKMEQLSTTVRPQFERILNVNK
jgi:hypothetical protein